MIKMLLKYWDNFHLLQRYGPAFAQKFQTVSDFLDLFRNMFAGFTICFCFPSRDILFQIFVICPACTLFIVKYKLWRHQSYPDVINNVIQDYFTTFIWRHRWSVTSFYDISSLYYTYHSQATFTFYIFIILM